MVVSLFTKYRQALNHFFEAAEPREMEALVKYVGEATGTLWITGVGKSGLIGQKIAATLTSTGTSAAFLSPLDALHGDLGALKEGDVLLALSKSGSSQELLEIIPFVRQKKIPVISFVSQKNSPLEALCQQTVYLPLLRELCPFDLAPTTSCALQLIAGDILAMALMEKKQFSMGDFAQNHPGGLLGQKISLKVADLMLTGEALPLCRPSDPLLAVLAELSQKRCGCLLVVEKGELRGIFTDGDLRRALENKGASAMEMRLEELMNRSPKSISREQLSLEAMQMMEGESHRPITVLPVLEAGRLVGLIRMHDILQTGLHRRGK